jgi:hypothetical protein
VIVSLLRWMEEELRLHGLHDRADLVHEASLDPGLRPHLLEQPQPRLPRRAPGRASRTARRFPGWIDNQPSGAIPFNMSLPLNFS